MNSNVTYSVEDVGAVPATYEGQAGWVAVLTERTWVFIPAACDASPRLLDMGASEEEAA